MADLKNGTTLNDTITISKQNGTKITLDTDKKYLEKDIELTFNIQSGTATTPATTITTNPTITVNDSGLITASYSGSKSITPTVDSGWIESGTAGTISTNGSATKQLTTKAATTYNTSTSDQTIASDTYLTGTQTIRKVITSGISAANIKSGTTIKVGDAADDDRIASVTGTFTKANTVSSGQTAATASQLLSGYSAWVDGTEIKGNLVNKNSNDLNINGKTITIPAGCYDEDISADIALGSITSGSATINSASYTYNSTSDKFDVTGSASIAAPTINTAGYVSSSEGTKTGNTANLSMTVNKITGSTSITGTTTMKPVISKQNTPNGVTNAASGDATTTAPSSGVYIAVKTAANTGTLTATPSVSTAGYGTSSAHGISNKTATVGASASDTTYIPITTTSASVSGATVSYGSGWITEGSKTVANGSATTPATTITSNPSISIDADGLITASYSSSKSITPTVSAGYVSSGTAGTVSTSGSNTKQLTTKATTTYNTSTSDQEIASETYLTGKQTIKAVTTANIDAANIKKDIVIKVGDANSATRIKNVTGTFTKANTVSSGQTAATAAQIRSGYSAWVDGAEVKGSLGNTSVSQGTTTVSGTTATRGTATWGNGVISSGSIGAATFANTATSDVTYVDISNTTAAPVLVSGDSLYINKGYVDNLKISLAKLVPDGASADLASDVILSGYSAYNNDGTLIAGNIPSKSSSDLGINGRTITAPAGYYASGASKSIGTGTVTSGTANITSLTRTYNSTSGKFDITGSADVSTPTVGTAGYISSSEGTRNAKTGGATVSTTVNKIVASTSITGTTTKKPSITKRDVPSGVTQAASGNATTTAPSSGVYVAVKSDANTGTLTATPSVTTAGYGDATNNGLSGNTATVGASASDTTYIPITTTSASVSGKTVSYGTGWITGGSKSVADGTITNNTTLPSGTTSSGTINRGSYIKIGAGYHTEKYYLAQADSGTLTIDTSKNRGTISVNGYANIDITGINIPKPSSGTNTFQIKVPNGGSDTITFTFTVDTNGNTTVS